MKRVVDKFLYGSDPMLVDNPSGKNMNLLLVQGMLSTAMVIFTGGLFLTGLLIHLGASDTVVSMVEQLPNVCSVFILFFSTLINNARSRKLFTIISGIVSKTFIISAVFVPLFVEKRIAVTLIFMLMTVGQAIGILSMISYNTWFNGLIHEDIRGRVFSARQTCCVIVTLIIQVGGAWYLDSVNHYFGFVVLYLCGAAVSLLELAVYFRIDDVKPIPKEKMHTFLHAILLPLKNRRFMRFVILMCAFQFFSHLSFAYCNVYVVRYIGLSFTYINLCSIICYSAQIFFFYKAWGKVVDKVGSRIVIVLTMLTFVPDAFAWASITKDTVWVIYPVLNFVGAIQSGLTVGTFHKRFEIIPEEERAIYDSFYISVLGLTYLISPLTGRALQGIIMSIPSFAGIPNANFRLTFIITGILIGLLQIPNIREGNREDPDGKLFSIKNFSAIWDIFRS